MANEITEELRQEWIEKVEKEGPYALEDAPKRLRSDKEFMLEAVKRYGSALQFASWALQEDKEVVLAAVTSCGGALEYASDELRDDKEVVLVAVKNPDTDEFDLPAYPFSPLQYASDRLKADKEVALAALRARLGQAKTDALFRVWFDDGGLMTYRAYMRLDEATRHKVLDYVQDMHFIYELQCGKRYFLAHTVPPYSQDVPLTEHPADDFLHGAPDYHIRYLPDCTIITGHTHTERIDPAYRGRIWHGNGHIAIDCGASRGDRLGCLCLDTMQEFYE